MTKAELGERLAEEKRKFCSQYSVCEDCPLNEGFEVYDDCDRLIALADRLKGI